MMENSGHCDPLVFTTALVEVSSVISNHRVGLRFKLLLSSFRWWKQIKDETWPWYNNAKYCRGRGNFTV